VPSITLVECHPIEQSIIRIVSERIPIRMEPSCLKQEIFVLRNLAIQPIVQIGANPSLKTICDI